MKKKILSLSLALGLVLVGCNSDAPTGSADSQDAIKIGIAQYADHESLDLAREGMVDGLEEMGYDLDVDFVNLQSDMTLIEPTAAKFKSDGVDLIYAIATPVAQGMKNAVTDIPVVYNAVTDPETAGLEGPNVSGVSDYYPIKDQLEAFQADFPDLTSFGVIYDTAEVNSEMQVNELRDLQDELGFELIEVGISTTNDIPQALSSMVSKIDAFIMITDNMTVSAAPIIANTLVEEGIYSYTVAPSPVSDGILVSSGIDYYQLGRDASTMVDQILQGAIQEDMDILYPSKSQKLVNETTATSLGIDESSSLFDGADIIK